MPSACRLALARTRTPIVAAATALAGLTASAFHVNALAMTGAAMGSVTSPMRT